VDTNEFGAQKRGIFPRIRLGKSETGKAYRSRKKTFPLGITKSAFRMRKKLQGGKKESAESFQTQ